jgi:hypothetical protein
MGEVIAETPVPVNATLDVSDCTESVSTRVAEKLVAPDGVNLTVTLQVAPAASVGPQVLDASENCSGLVPPKVSATFSVPVPVLLNVMFELFREVPTNMEPNT